jgi:hypothetical protein
MKLKLRFATLVARSGIDRSYMDENHASNR